MASDAISQLYETATFCKLNDEKRPALVSLPDGSLQQLCDDDIGVAAAKVTTAYPDGWYVRIMFDELLDGDIEELVPIPDPDTGDDSGTFSGTIANTHPVELQCESLAGGYVDVPYDGYYSPSGNRESWPLGPSLVIQPSEPTSIATTKNCRVTLNANVVDKSGTPVPADQRGPFEFQLAPITPIAISVDDDPDGENPIPALSIYSDNVIVQFNTAIDPASWCDEGAGTDCEFEFLPVDGGAGTCSMGGQICKVDLDCPTVGDTCDIDVLYNYNLAGGGVFTDSGENEWGFGTTTPNKVSSMYTFQFKAGTKVADRCGVETTFGAPSPADLTQVRYATDSFKLTSSVPGTGDTPGAIRKPVVQFNNAIDVKSLDATEYTLTPAPASPSVVSTGGNNGDLKFAGHYTPETAYTLTINQGATVLDAHGAPYTFAAPRTIMWTTAKIAVVSTSPANNGVKTKATPASFTTIDISFNQSMDPTSLTNDDVTLTDGTTPVLFNAAATIAAGCGPASTSCTLRLTTATPLATGTDYTFTLKQGAALTDVLGTAYTQATALNLAFTVVDAAAPTPAVECL